MRGELAGNDDFEVAAFFVILRNEDARGEDT